MRGGAGPPAEPDDDPAVHAALRIEEVSHARGGGEPLVGKRKIDSSVTHLGLERAVPTGRLARQLAGTREGTCASETAPWTWTSTSTTCCAGRVANSSASAERRATRRSPRSYASAAA